MPTHTFFSFNDWVFTQSWWSPKVKEKLAIGGTCKTKHTFYSWSLVHRSNIWVCKWPTKVVSLFNKLHYILQSNSDHIWQYVLSLRIVIYFGPLLSLLRKYAKEIIRNVNKCFLEQKEKSVLNMETVEYFAFNEHL